LPCACNMVEFYHSVTLHEEQCVGCTNCIKRCPTEAIRVRGGKAVIAPERCIDCGECIRICPHHAKRARYTQLSRMQEFKYNIALPAPTLYGQFNNLDDIDYVLTGLKEMGFDMVFEVSRAAELISEATRKLMDAGKLKRPVISSACPAVVRMIRVRFPDLVDNVLPLKSPMETAAAMAKQQAHEETGLPYEDIGCFFITPCPAKVTDIKAPIGLEKSMVDGALAISDVFPMLSSKMDHLTSIEPIANSGIIGVGWATSGGESAALLNEKYLAADGIENVIRVLEEIEDERIGELDFIELNACAGGCVGGVLCVENPYVAKARIQRLRKYLPVSQNHLQGGPIPSLMEWESGLEFSNVMSLSENLQEAMMMMVQIDEMEQEFPGLDCGACGSPTCRAFAEDVVKGGSRKTDCVFVYRKQLQQVASTLSALETAPCVLPQRDGDDCQRQSP
jgi:iron only hydrogenase large subunit-like protein